MTDHRPTKKRVKRPRGINRDTGFYRWWKARGKHFAYLLRLRRNMPGATDEAMHRSMMESGYIWGWMDRGARDRAVRDAGRKR